MVAVRVVELTNWVVRYVAWQLRVQETSEPLTNPVRSEAGMMLVAFVLLTMVVGNLLVVPLSVQVIEAPDSEPVPVTLMLVAGLPAVVELGPTALAVGPEVGGEVPPVQPVPPGTIVDSGIRTQVRPFSADPPPE
jgi:hypothetical protein